MLYLRHLTHHRQSQSENNVAKVRQHHVTHMPYPHRTDAPAIKISTSCITCAARSSASIPKTSLQFSITRPLTRSCCVDPICDASQVVDQFLYAAVPASQAVSWLSPQVMCTCLLEGFRGTLVKPVHAPLCYNKVL